jgi:hypothetical protein
MWAEITVDCKKELPANLRTAFEARLGHSYDGKQALEVTILKSNNHIVDHIIFARLDDKRVYLVQAPDVSLLTIHIESTVKTDDIRELRRAIEYVLSRIESFLKGSRNKVKNMKVLIYAEGNYLQTGTYMTRWEIVKDKFKENVLLKIYIPVSTFALSLLLNYDVKKAGINALAAVIAALLWVVIEVMLFKRKIAYKEE